MTKTKEIVKWFLENRNEWNGESAHNFLLDIPCPECNCHIFYIGVNYIKSFSNPKLVSPFAFCENCGYEDSHGYKYFLQHLKLESK